MSGTAAGRFYKALFSLTLPACGRAGRCNTRSVVRDRQLHSTAVTSKRTGAGTAEVQSVAGVKDQEGYSKSLFATNRHKVSNENAGQRINDEASRKGGEHPTGTEERGYFKRLSLTARQGNSRLQRAAEASKTYGTSTHKHEDELDSALRSMLHSANEADDVFTGLVDSRTSAVVTQNIAVPGKIASLFPHLEADRDARQGHVKIRRLGNTTGGENDSQDIELSGHPDAVKYVRFQLTKFIEHEWALLRNATARVDEHEVSFGEDARPKATSTSDASITDAKPDAKQARKPSQSSKVSTATRQLLRSIHNPVFLVTTRNPSVAPSTSSPSITSSGPQSITDATRPLPLSHCHGATISSLTSITLHPTPIISFNLHKRSTTYRAIAAHSTNPRGEFSVHALADSSAGQTLAELFADPALRSGLVDDPLLAALPGLRGHDLLPAAGMGGDLRIVGRGVLARLACRLRGEWTVSVGEKKVVFAEVLAVLKGRDGAEEELEKDGLAVVRGLGYVDGNYVVRQDHESAGNGVDRSVAVDGTVADDENELGILAHGISFENGRDGTAKQA